MVNKIKHGPVQSVRGAEQGSHVSALDHDGMGCGFEGEGGMSMAGPKQLFAAEGNGKPIQRQVEEYRKTVVSGITQNDVDAAERVAYNIDKRVTEARAIALNWVEYKECDGHLKVWYNTADSYFQDPDTPLQLVNANFGYAVETLVCAELDATMEGLDVFMQVGHGTTRPDVVLKLKNGTEVAWLDITSKGDIGHIKRKGGDGWGSKAYVAELLYEQLDPKEILNGMKNPIVNNQGKFKQEQQGIRDQARLRHKDDIKQQIQGFQQQQNFFAPNGNQRKKEQATKKFLQDDMGIDLGKASTINAKGALSYLDFNTGHFGYKKGGSSQQQIVSHINKQAQPDIDAEMNDLLDGKAEDQQKALKAHYFHPEADAYLQQSHGFDQKSKAEKEEVVKLGIAAQTAVELESKLRSVYFKYLRYGKDDDLVQQRLGVLNLYLLRKPNQFDLQELYGWAQKVNEFLEQVPADLDVLGQRHANNNNNNNNNSVNDFDDVEMMDLD